MSSGDSGKQTRGRDDATARDGRSRLIEAARALFVARGAANVGINEVTEAAGVARMTLYNNFRSKEDLVAAVYDAMARETLDRVDAIVAGDGDDRTMIADIFAYFAARSDTVGYRGCTMIHGSLQDAQPLGPIYRIAQSYKRELRGRLRRCVASGPVGDALADQLLILLDGMVTELYLKGAEAPARAATNAAMLLVDASTPAVRVVPSNCN